MRSLWLGVGAGAASAALLIGACALDESGTASDGGFPDVAVVDVFDGGVLGDGDAAQTFDVPDLGTGETEAGPCTCVSSVPSGFNVVEYDQTGRINCTTSYAGHVDIVETTAAGSTCSCTCNPTPTTPPLCSCGGSPAKFDLWNGNGSCADAGLTLLADLNCYKTSQPYSAPGNGLNNIAAVPEVPCSASGGSCSGPIKVMTIPPPTTDQGRACDLTPGTIGSCGGGVCVPTPGASYRLCITNNTITSCTGFADFPYAHTVGTGVSDTRNCGPSPCNSCGTPSGGSCGAPQLSLFASSDNNCGGGPDSILPADGTCKGLSYGNGVTFGSTSYSVPEDGGVCAFGGAYGPTGNLGVAGAFTICCHTP